MQQSDRPVEAVAAVTSSVVRDTEQFRALKTEWNELLQSSQDACPFLTWEWMFHWWLNLAERRRLHVIVVRRDGLLIALAPLVLKPPRLSRLRLFSSLEFMGSGAVGCDYLSMLIRRGREDEALDEVARVLVATDLVLELVRVDKSSTLMTRVALRLRACGWQCLCTITNHSPHIRLRGHDWDSYLDTLSRAHRANVGKKLKRLHREFRVEFRLAGTEPERQEALATFIRLHLHRWSGDGGSTALDGKELIFFHEDVSRAFLEQGWLRLYTLLLDEVAVASLYIFRYGEVCYYYQAAFDPACNRYSVGTLALALGIRQSLAEGAAEFDMLHDDEEYKYLWCRDERVLVRMDLFPPRSSGRLLKQALAFKAGLKHLVRHCRPWLYQ